MAHDRAVAGLRCSQVLELLSEFIDEALPAEQAEQIQAHLAGCDWCERFGQRFSGTIAALRQNLADPAPLDPDLIARLHDRLNTEL